MSDNEQASLADRLRKALAQDETLARKVIRELADKDDLLERVEDAVAEKMDYAQRLEVAEEQLQAISSQTTRLQKLEKDYKEALEAKRAYAEKLQALESSAGDTSSSAGQLGGREEILSELEELRRARRDLEQELQMRDEVLASLRKDLQQGSRTPTGDSDYDALLEEKNNLAEQLTLALSQLEEITDREGLVDKLDQSTRRSLDLEEQLQRVLGENKNLKGRLEESEEKLKQAQQRSPSEQEQSQHNPATVWLVGILLIVGIYGAMKFTSPRGKTPEEGRPPSSLVQERPKVVPEGILARLARVRLNRQKISFALLLEKVESDSEFTVDELSDAVFAALDGDDPYRRGLAQIVRGNFAEALTPLEREEEVRKQELGLLYYLRGRAAFLAGRVEEARRFLKIAVERDYTLVAAWRALGDLYVFEDETEEAFRCYGEALGVNPEDALSLIALGGLHSLNDSLDEAVQSYEKAIEADPNLPEAHYELGMLYQRKEDWGKAALSFEETILLQEGNARANWYLGRCYQILGKQDKARKHKERAKALGYREVIAAPPGAENTAISTGSSEASRAVSSSLDTTGVR